MALLIFPIFFRDCFKFCSGTKACKVQAEPSEITDVEWIVLMCRDNNHVTTITWQLSRDSCHVIEPSRNCVQSFNSFPLIYLRVAFEITSHMIVINTLRKSILICGNDGMDLLPAGCVVHASVAGSGRKWHSCRRFDWIASAMRSTSLLRHRLLPAKNFLFHTRALSPS